MALQWTQDLTTMIAEIDDQHKELFKQLDTLLSAWKNGKGREETEKIIRFLNDYVTFHFGTEEKYMDKFAYTNTSAHKAQHAVFVNSWERLKERYFRSGSDDQLIRETNEQVVDWFVNHIRYVDKALGLFLKRKL